MATPKVESFNLEELRSVLSDNIRSVQKSELTPASANAVTTAVGTFLRSVKLEMDYYRMIGKTPDIPLLGGTAEDKKAAA